MANRICKDCVGDSYLKSLIGDQKVLFLECTYCGQFYETIPISELADRIDAAIENFFNPTNLDDGPRWDRDPDGDPLPAIIERYADVSEEVAKDLAEILKDMWFDRDAMCHQYGEDPYFVEKKPEISVLSNTWQRMEHSLKHEARLVNPVVVGVLSDLFGPILEDRTYEGKEVVAEIGNGSQVEFLYRARVFQTTRAMEHALSHPERHLGPPPEGEGAAGRMNAKGVSVFYGSTTQSIALSEVRPPVGCYVVIAKFKILAPLRVLDLTQLGSIAVQSESIFDQKTADEARRSNFLAVLSNRLMMPVMPELEERDYLITQAIADFLATNEKLKLDGIMFRSAQDPEARRAGGPRNITLFNKASRVRRAGAEYAGTVNVYLIETDDDGVRFAPQIFSEPEKMRKIRRAWEDEAPVETLELDKDAIEIHEVSSVSYRAMEHVVQHTQLREYSSKRIGRDRKF